MENIFYNKEKKYYNLKDSNIASSEIGEVWIHSNDDLYFIVESPEIIQKFKQDVCLNFCQEDSLANFIANTSIQETTNEVNETPVYFYIVEFLKSESFPFLKSDFDNTVKNEEVFNYLLSKGFEPCEYISDSKNHRENKYLGFYTNMGWFKKMIKQGIGVAYNSDYLNIGHESGDGSYENDLLGRL